jgi:hypothetical protein
MLTGGPNKAVVTVSAEYGGKRITLGSETFRLKNIPDPVVTINRMPAGQVNKNDLMTNGIIYATRPAGFDLPATFTVQSFKFYAPGDGAGQIIGTGRSLSDQMINNIKKTKRDQVIILYDIKVNGPDGPRVLQNPVTYRIN